MAADVKDTKPAPPVTEHTKRVRRSQAVAKGVLWFAAGLTMTLLLLIVGYIVWNGIYHTTIQTDPVVPDTQQEVLLDPERNVTLQVVVNDGLRVDTLNYDTLRGLYRGETAYWGRITGQDREATVLAYGGEPFRQEAAEYMLGADQKFTEMRYLDQPAVQVIPNRGELAERLRSEPGAVALVPGEWASELRGVQTISLRQISVVVHPGIMELQQGRRLNDLDFTQVRGLFTGSVEAWKAVGGPSKPVAGTEQFEPLPVKPILFEPSVSPYAALPERLFGDVELRDNAVRVDSMQEFTEKLRSTEGAVGIVRRSDAVTRDLQSVSVERTEGSFNLRPSFFVTPPSRAGAVGGISTIIVNTLAMVAFVILITTPIGLSAAIYLVEYARQGRLLYYLRLGTDTLAGVPSILFGLFGMVFFAQVLGFQTGLLSGTLTLTLMILPTVIRTSEEALRSVPNALRQGSLAIGATKIQTIFRVVLPAATPGILTGMILGIGRAVGETAALLFTMGSNLAAIRSLNSPIRVLSVHLYMLIRENISMAHAFGTATTLVIIVFLVNFTTRRLIGRMNKMAGS